MGEKVKLTKPQRDLLADLGCCDQRVAATYTPAVKLIELGLAERRLLTWLSITPAGRALLQGGGDE